MQLVTYILGVLLFLTGIPQESFTYFQDIKGEYSVSDLDNIAFQTTTDNNLGTNNGVYWFRIETIAQERAILELRSSRAEDVRLFNNNGVELSKMQDTRYPAFFLNAKKLNYPIYLKATFPLEAHFPIYISNEAEFAKDEKYSLLSIGFFYGTALALTLATSIFFFITRNKQFLFYGVLALAICMTIAAKDNILYLFNIRPSFISSLELLGHYLVGLSATGFVFMYLRFPNKKLANYIFGTFSSMATLLLVAHLITKSLWSFILTDVFSLLTAASLWILVFTRVRSVSKKLFLSIIYLINCIVIIDAFVLQSLGLSILELEPLQISLIAIFDFTLIATSLLLSFRRLQGRTIIMKHQIKMYLEKLSTLDQYRTVQDADDTYLESLIEQFELENIEVKVLDSISKGLTNERIATKYNLSTEKLQNITIRLYDKLGLDYEQDLGKALGY